MAKEFVGRSGANEILTLVREELDEYRKLLALVGEFTIGGSMSFNIELGSAAIRLPENYNGPKFQLNENGCLEVKYDG